MKIQILGSGCSTCKKLYELTQEAAKQLNLNEKIEYITDVSKIIEAGIMSGPVLMINNKSVVSGHLPSIEKIKSILAKGSCNSETKNSESNSDCDRKGCC